MKKTLIALAVLAASGASFAQVSITGNYTAGYRASTAPAGDAGGFGIDTSLVTFTASEDLGGGLTAKAEMKIDGLSRGGVAGGDSGLSLSGGFGKIALETGRGGDYLSGGTSGVGGVGWDGKVFSTLTASDSVAYTSPSFGGFTVGLSHDEGATSQGGENASPIGLGSGAAGTPVGVDYQRGSGVTLAYAAGPLSVNGNYKVWDQQGAGTTAATGAGNSKNRISVRVAYDFGAFKVGAGFRNQQFVVGTRQDALVSAAFPVTSQLTLGANWASRVQNDTVVSATGAVTTGTKTGTSLKAEYALSKRTSLVGSYARWDQAVGQTSANTETNLLLSHSF